MASGQRDGAKHAGDRRRCLTKRLQKPQGKLADDKAGKLGGDCGAKLGGGRWGLGIFRKSSS